MIVRLKYTTGAKTMCENKTTHIVEDNIDSMVSEDGTASDSAISAAGSGCR